MDEETDIAKLLMMEMEQEVERAGSQVSSVPKTSTRYPLFEISSIYDKDPKEDDAIQSEIERRLKSKQEEHQLHGDTTQLHSQDIREHPAYIQTQKTNNRDFFFENTSESHQHNVEGGVEYSGDNGEWVRRESEEQAKRETEEQARREAQELARREAEEQARREAQELAKREAEEQAKREAQELAKREAEEQARREAQELARREAEEQARREAQELAKREAEEQARREAQELARREAEEQARREAQELAKREAEEQARREAQELARREAEEQARREAQELARREAEEQARREAQELAKREAEEQAKREAQELAKREAEEQARREAQELAKREAEEEVGRGAQELARREAEEQARREAQELAKREAEEQAKREAQELAKREAEEQARREAQELAKREAEEQARREAQELAKREAEEQARREAQELAKREAEEEVGREAQELARREAEEQARREAQELAKREAEEQAKREAQELAKREAEEQARREAQELARREAEEQARREAQELAKREAEEQARREAQELAKREAEEEVGREAQELARREAEEQARREAQELAKREAEEQAKREAQELAKREAEEQARREAQELARREAEEQARREAQELAKREAEEQARREAQELAKREAEEQAKREAQELAKREAEEQARREAQELARREAEEQARREAQELAKREAEEQARREAQELAKREAEEEVGREAQELAKREAEEQVGRTAEKYSRYVPVSKAVTYLDDVQNKLKGPSVVSLKASTSLKVGSEDEQNNVEVHKGGRNPVKGNLSRSSSTLRYDVKTDDDVNDKSETVSDSRSFVSTVCGDTQNDNGILGADSFEIGDDACPPDDTFEEFFARKCFQMGLHEDSLRRQRIERRQYETIREPGRCLYPTDEVRSDVISTANVQLGFFRSRQEILTGVLARQKRVAQRERRAEPGQRELSSVHCYFENELLQDTSVTFDDDHLPHNAQGECVMMEKELVTSSPTGSVSKALALMTFGDPIQVWERACGHSFDLTTRSAKGLPDVTHTDGLTAGMIWSNEIDTRKPTRAVSVFSGGALLQVRCVKLSNPMFEIHGNAVDPILIASAFYNVSSNTQVKVSETFFFSSSVDIFYPHKERNELQRENRSVVFIPQEFRSSLYLVTRVYRPTSENFEEYVDLYTRPDRYKKHHVAPMKEKTQLIAMSSDVLEEMGWNYVRCSDQDGLQLSTLQVKKLFRKQVDDTEMYNVINNDRSWSSMLTLPFDLEFSLTDCSNHEVAFPSRYAESRPEENETILSLLNPDVPGALSEICRYVPCAIPILNSGFFHAYHSVYYFRLSKVKVISGGILRKIPSTHRTFVVHICVKDQDTSLAEDGLPLIYGSRLSGQTLETSAWSSTVHAAPEFSLSDEFKIQLPLYLTDNHHLFLTLYATHQRKNPSVEGQQRLYKVGYAAFPISRLGVVQVKEDWSIPFISADQATVIAAGGYLSKFPDAPASALLNNATPVLSASSQTRTSVHASNRTIAGVFRDSPESLKRITEDDDALTVSGKLSVLSSTAEDDVHSKVTALIRQLPLAEILAFYPYLCSYSLALISSSSRRVSLPCRTAALDALIDITFKAHQYDSNTRFPLRQNPSSHVHGFRTITHTSVTSILYHHLTNDVLYSGKVYRLYAGVAEVWLHLLTEVHADHTDAVEGCHGSDAQSPREKARPGTRNRKKQMVSVSWFLFDVILRSIYLWALDNPNVPRTQLLDPSFYDIAARLCEQILNVLCGFVDDGDLVPRVALFVRNLSNFGDRGRVLGIHSRVIEFLKQQGEANSLCTYLRLVLEEPDVLTLMLPSPSHSSPIFLTRMIVESLSLLILHKERVTRAEAGTALYNFLCGLSNNNRVTSSSLRLVAAQLFPLLVAVAEQWKTFVALCDKSDAGVAVGDKRQVVVAMLWIAYYIPRGTLRRWLHSASDGRGIFGFLSIASDAQSLLRYHGGIDKAGPKAAKSSATELREWDARMSTFVAAIGAQVCSIVLEDIPHVLRLVKNDKMPPTVFNFFVLLENVVSLGHSTLALQFGASALFETLLTLFPEIMSRGARMSGGFVHLVFRLMSSCCQYVRGIAGRSFFIMCQSFFTWTGSLARIQSITANALVSVAESKSRSLRLAGRFIEFQLDELLERARREEAHFASPAKDYNMRYDRDSNQLGGDSGTQYRYRVADLFLSVIPQIPMSHYLLEQCDTDSDSNTSAEGQSKKQVKHSGNQRKSSGEAVLQFSVEFAALSKTGLSLFRDVLRLQTDNSMKFKEARIFAYFEVFRNFLRQNALIEVLKWLRRLHSAHKADGDMAEAGMVLVFIAALCFRVTEMFYLMRGHNSRGACMPSAVFTHVFWHDYVRLLPELDMFLHPDTICAIVSELHVCPDDTLFTIEGQIKVLKEASEHLDKDQYYEFALGVATIVDKYLRAVGDFKGASAVHSAMSTWCQAIAQRGRRQNHRYFLLWARMERAEPARKERELQHEGEDAVLGERAHGLPGGRAIKRVHKMPPTTSLEDFTDYAKSFVTTYFEDPSLVVVTEDLFDTSTAPPDPMPRKKHITAMQRPPNRCWVTVFEVHASFPKGEPIPPEGFDKAMHIQRFENIMHVRLKTDGAVNSNKVIDLMNHRMSINMYTLERAFPSTTSAIDVSETSEVLLDLFQTARETLNNRIDIIKQAPENDMLIAVLRDALSPMGISPPGTYMKEIITTMSGYPDIILSVKSIGTLARDKLLVCEKLDVMTKSPEDYALVLKAVTDIECCLIAMEESPYSGVDRDD